MEARMHHRSLTLEPADGWVRDVAGLGNMFELVSPRGAGRLRLDCVRMPADMRAFDVASLRRQMTKKFLPAAYDEASWKNGPLVCVAQTRRLELPPLGDLENTLAMLTDARSDDPFAPRVCREWIVAQRTAIANVWFDSLLLDANLSADLVDCEVMVRSLRFGSS